MANVESSREVAYNNLTAYERWQQSQGIPIVKGYYVDDINTVSVLPWPLKGGLGCFIDLEGAEQSSGAYVCEIPPGVSLRPQKHLFEELIIIISGRGATTIWKEGGAKQTFEWAEGSLFSPPLNTWHQHFNGQGDKPARYLAVTSAPMTINLFHNLDFIFNNNFIFTDRYGGEEDYFSSQGKSSPLRKRVWESNFIPDVFTFKLQEWQERGAGGANISFWLSGNIMGPHISEFPAGTYKKAHRHGPGAHVIILSGRGYSLMWPEGQPRIKIDWQKGSMVVPPGGWFHQHFNLGTEPARYLALKMKGGKRSKRSARPGGDVSLKLGGSQIEYEDEDPEIRRLYEQELAKLGSKMRMPPVARR